VKLVDPDGQATTIIITHSGPASDFILGGSHSGAHFSNPKNGRPSLYDPGGSYKAVIFDDIPEVDPDHPRRIDRPGSNATFEGEASNLLNYIRYHLDSGDPSVTAYTFNTTTEQEASFIKNIPDNAPGQGLCVYGVSSLLKDLGLSTSLFPRGLTSDLDKLFIKNKDMIKSVYIKIEKDGKMFIKKTDYYYDINKKLQKKETLIPID
jgi:hypothetical protein